MQNFHWLLLFLVRLIYRILDFGENFSFTNFFFWRSWDVVDQISFDITLVTVCELTSGPLILKTESVYI